MSRFIGVDLHKTAFTVCFMEGEEKRFETYKIDEVDRFRGNLQSDDEVALGVCRAFGIDPNISIARQTDITN